MSRPLLRLALGIMVLSTASASAADAPPTFSGNYLAGVVARKANDDARASEAFRRALDLTDGKNQKLLDVSMLADAMLGRWETAVPLAARLTRALRCLLRCTAASLRRKAGKTQPISTVLGTSSPTLPPMSFGFDLKGRAHLPKHWFGCWTPPGV